GGGTSSHGFGLAEAIPLARTLQLTPRKIIVYAIEGRCFDPGLKPTADVAAAVALLARAIALEVARLRQAIRRASLTRALIFPARCGHDNLQHTARRFQRHVRAVLEKTSQRIILLR
ncbi:hypothetical protein B1A_13856, partial [mine drainage metagenome]